MASGFKGILFDFDGTLADTMEGHFLAWESALGEHGISIKPEDYYPLEGIDLHEVARQFADGPTWTAGAIDRLVQKKKECYVSRQTVTFYPGVELLISELDDRNVPMAIVTAGHRDQLESSVPEAFLKHFNAVMTGDQFARGKPDPEPYLKGALALGLPPTECIAVENAPMGIQSAKRAHSYCIAICSTVDRDVLNEADEVIDQFEDLRMSAIFGQILA